jgi:hypothetical protein
MFLIHFLGDIHQPLHTENVERRGNGIPVCFDRHFTDMNLHGVWDADVPTKHRGIPHHEKPDAEKEAAASWAPDLFGSNRARGLTTSTECNNIESA